MLKAFRRLLKQGASPTSLGAYLLWREINSDNAIAVQTNAV